MEQLPRFIAQGEYQDFINKFFFFFFFLISK